MCCRAFCRALTCVQIYACVYEYMLACVCVCVSVLTYVCVCVCSARSLCRDNIMYARARAIAADDDGR